MQTEVWSAETCFRFGCTVSEAKRVGWSEGAAKAESCLRSPHDFGSLSAISGRTLIRRWLDIPRGFP